MNRLTSTHHQHQHGCKLGSEKVLKKTKIVCELLIYRSSSTAFKLQVLVQWDDVTDPTIGCVVFIITCFQSPVFHYFYDKLRLYWIGKWSFKLTKHYVWFMAQLKPDQTIICLSSFTAIQRFLWNKVPRGKPERRDFGSLLSKLGVHLTLFTFNKHSRLEKSEGCVHRWIDFC